MAVGLGAAPAHALDVGLGVAAGGNFSVAQADNGNGGLLAVRVPVHVVPLLTVEPFLNWSKMGSASTTIGGVPHSRDGFGLVGYGGILALGSAGMSPGWPVYPYLGVGGFSLKREGAPQTTHPGYLVGVGYARPLPRNIAFNARAGYTWVTENGASRQFFDLTVGVSIRLHPIGGEEEEL
jgi:hypothetical protein